MFTETNNIRKYFQIAVHVCLRKHIQVRCVKMLAYLHWLHLYEIIEWAASSILIFVLLYILIKLISLMSPTLNNYHKPCQAMLPCKLTFTVDTAIELVNTMVLVSIWSSRIIYTTFVPLLIKLQIFGQRH